jgi:hypothetical protein
VLLVLLSFYYSYCIRFLLRGTWSLIYINNEKCQEDWILWRKRLIQRAHLLCARYLVSIYIRSCFSPGSNGRNC